MGCTSSNLVQAIARKDSPLTSYRSPPKRLGVSSRKFDSHALQHGYDISTLGVLLDMEATLAWAKEDRLRNMDVFVLDNSLRETAVAAIKGQVSSDKDQILSALDDTGISDFIVASFGQLRRPEDVWLHEKSRQDKVCDNWWAFSEMANVPTDADTEIPLPYGIERCRQYGIKNIILEIDAACRDLTAKSVGFDFSVDAYRQLFQNRLDFIREFSPDGKVLINLRDAPSSFHDKQDERNLPKRLENMIEAASKVEPKIFGLIFEDPIAEFLPWQIGMLSAFIKRKMQASGWGDGHLLIHVHKRFALSDSAVLEALAMGCTGIWCAVCEEGGGMGHPCSLTTLVNLARLGNQNVIKKYNLRAMYNAAIKITQITTGRMPHPRTEVYGAQAMDIYFPDGAMGGSSNVDLSDLMKCQSKRNIRVTQFTDEEMMREKLTHVFGEHEWESNTIHSMIIMIHADLESGYSWNYNGPASLLDLYIRAGGTKFVDSMEAVLVNTHFNLEKADPLIRQLRRKFKACIGTIDTASQEESPMEKWARRRSHAFPAISFEEDKSEDYNRTEPPLRASFQSTRASCASIQTIEDCISYDEFFHGFLTPYHKHTESIDPLSDKVILDVIEFFDSDGSGQIEWRELCSTALFVLENADPEDKARWTLRDLLNAMFQSARMEDTAQTLFLRNNEELVDDVCKSIAGDVRLQELWKTRDAHVLKNFVTSLFLVVSSGDGVGFDEKKMRPKILSTFGNTCDILFKYGADEEAFDIMLEHFMSNPGNSDVTKAMKRPTFRESVMPYLLNEVAL